MHEELKECTAAANVATEEAEEEEKEEEGSLTEELAPAEKQAPKPQVALPVAPEFWAMGPSGEVAGHGLAISKRAWGKETAMQVGPEPPAFTNEELVCQL